MKAVCIIDTSVFVEIVGVPNMAADPKSYRKELVRKIAEGEALMLPVVTIVETGNHIGQNGDGTQRRTTAVRFIDQVTGALNGTVPFTVTPLHEKDRLLVWLAGFHEWVKVSDKKGKGSGFGDYLISQDFEVLCGLNKARRVYVWSLDERLVKLDREPELS